MISFVLYYISSVILGQIFQYYFAVNFSFSVDIFLILLIFNSLNCVFNVGLISSILHGFIMDYFTGLPLGFFVFSYVLIFYVFGKIKFILPKRMLSMTMFFILSKFIIWFVAMSFADFVDLKGFNYTIFNLNLIVNIIFINFLYPILSYFTRNLYAFREEY
ncbi:rod shape-determining protein MreD [Candidatus Borreliella tachyglossi]|uniref:Rod shape-determining protein MreD n=1 Tax=Candidatus Borreliella tachyglossi TaxID=1964448 RepID=A0A2S1LXP2_9SPIR|nr:rod shape-determining protein MreD [Candidatus Borreliella tachyglossi]AWG43069.1 rod shape-determining protein MreD [Candidatus Borreliella tachyglossi]